MTAQRIHMPKSPEERRAAKAASMRRYREKLRKREAVDAAINQSLGRGPAPPKGTLPKGGDLASMLRDRYLAVINQMTDDDLLNKDFAASLSVALKAQGQLDAREKQKQKQGNAELAFAIIGMLGGPVPVAALSDGMTIEGEAEVLHTEGEDGTFSEE